MKTKTCSFEGCNNPAWWGGKEPRCKWHPHEKIKADKPSKPIDRSRPKSKYKQIYWDFFGYSQNEFIPCEVCEQQAVDIHHIDARGMGGDPTKSKDTIENLMALCRNCHTIYGDIQIYKDLLRQIHKKWMNKLTK